MYQEERLEEILDLLEQRPYATVHYLAEQIHISASSIRRDLQLLERQGRVKRSYGGVALRQREHTAAPYLLREREYSEQKARMASLAAACVQEGDTLFLDSSTSAAYVAACLPAKADLTVMTNNLKTAVLLGERGIRTYCTGGLESSDSCVLTQSLAADAVRRFHADKVIFSTFALTADGLLLDSSESETCIRRIMLHNAREKLFLCGSEKVGRSSAFTLCSLDEVDMAFRDMPWEAEWRQRYPHVRFIDR